MKKLDSSWRIGILSSDNWLRNVGRRSM